MLMWEGDLWFAQMCTYHSNRSNCSHMAFVSMCACVNAALSLNTLDFCQLYNKKWTVHPRRRRWKWKNNVFKGLIFIILPLMTCRAGQLLFYWKLFYCPCSILELDVHFVVQPGFDVLSHCFQDTFCTFIYTWDLSILRPWNLAQCYPSMLVAGVWWDIATWWVVVPSPQTLLPHPP